ncbi:hypothetical protein [Bacillus cereus]|uniref:hypothetical protein n=1 Tax=Bacillus cereus TaxID=1396 RepID=UPI001ABEF332|nr:hypothetical protein [Bacillus cereus]
MEITNIDLQRKIEMLQLCSVNDSIYNEYLKDYEELGIDVKRFEYYKMYGQRFVPYSKEYVIRSNMKELLKRDKEKYMQFNPSFFCELKRKMDIWKWKGKIKWLGRLSEWAQKQSKDGKK